MASGAGFVRSVAISVGGLITLLFASGAAPAGAQPASVAPAGAPVAHRALFEPPAGTVYLGVSTDFNRLDVFDAAAGIRGNPAIYGRWTTPDGSFAPTLAQASSRPGLTPMVNWNLPMDGGVITSGTQDAYITAQARAVEAYGRPVFVRLDWEMNAFWYPHWNLGAVTPAEYVASWRHAVALFRAAGATNAAFVWAPNVLDYFNSAGQRTRTSAWYPGDDAVDWIGLDAYPQSAPSDVLLNGIDGMNAIASFAAARAKPLMLAEWASNSPHLDTAAPTDLVLDWAQQHPATVKALVYFDFQTQGKDFTLVDRPGAAAEFRARTANRGQYVLAVVSAGQGVVPRSVAASSPQPTGAPVPVVPDSVLRPGATLRAGQFLRSTDGRVTAILQRDGNFVVYASGGRPLWATRTRWAASGNALVMQPDGNLVLYSSAGYPLWWTATAGKGSGSSLVVQNDGNLVLYRGSGQVVWAARG